MRLWRYFWLLVGLLIAGTSSAETVPATSGEYTAIAASWWSNTGFSYTAATPESVCQYMVPRYYGSTTVFAGLQDVTAFQKRCIAQKSDGTTSNTITVQANLTCRTGDTLSNGVCYGYVCPDSTWTLNGATCERQSCPAGEVYVDGQCRPECDALQSRTDENPNCHCSQNNVSIGNQVGTERSGSGSIPDSICIGGCTFKTGDAIGGGQWWFAITSTPTYEVCTGTATEDPMPERNTPPCGAGQGVMTSSTGAVKCVPEGTPDARKPDVKVERKKETYPDNSTATTEKTTTTDPATNAEHVQEVRTSSGGMAGAEGTTTTESESSNGTGEGDGNCEGEDCENSGDPFRDPTGDGFYQKGDRTIRDVIDDFTEKVNNAGAFAAAKNWLTVAPMLGSCGGMTAAVPLLNVTLSLDPYICGGEASVLMSIAGVVVLAMAAFAAWRIAFL